MKFLKNNEIDFKKWDEVILSSEMPLVFAQSFYLNATSPGWMALVEGDYKCVMPVTAKKKLNINYLIQPPFTPQLGLFGSYDQNITETFFKYLTEIYGYISIELNAANFFTSFKTNDKRTFIIDFGKSYSYNSNTKRNIAKANKLNLKFEEVPVNEILLLTKKYFHPFLKNKLKIKPNQIRIFDNLLNSSIEVNKLKTFKVTNDLQEVCAIAHFIFNSKHAVYLKGTSFDKNANSGSMHFLMHHAIEFFKKEKILIFDFGGGQSDSLGQFFSGFGASALNYKTLKLNNLPKAIKWLKK